MGENLRQMIAKLKEQKQNSQTSDKPAVKPAKRQVPQETEELNEQEDEYMDEDEENDEEIPEQEEKPAVKPSNAVKKPLQRQETEELTKEQQILLEIEAMQNNGRFRVELLHQLQGINRALTVIAGVLMDLSGNEQK